MRQHNALVLHMLLGKHGVAFLTSFSNKNNLNAIAGMSISSVRDVPMPMVSLFWPMHCFDVCKQIDPSSKHVERHIYGCWGTLFEMITKRSYKFKQDGNEVVTDCLSRILSS